MSMVDRTRRRILQNRHGLTQSVTFFWPSQNCPKPTQPSPKPSVGDDMDKDVAAYVDDDVAAYMDDDVDIWFINKLI
jgi:hypothetical protein